MLGVFAEFETNLRRERQMEGIARAKASGTYAGKGSSSLDRRGQDPRDEGAVPRRHQDRQGDRYRPGERLSRRLIATWEPDVLSDMGVVNWRTVPSRGW
jgi:DNA invertase Pin-like site-specific DNA recombinase